ncbi:hypothetical protein BJ166DRAFT_176429 [Pestalotiopsis sp. NC0098]|nr:hypothetical protein BJ166DRAFT_176429 [Pestalotiopsis sp. NC0098]
MGEQTYWVKSRAPRWHVYQIHRDPRRMSKSEKLRSLVSWGERSETEMPFADPHPAAWNYPPHPPAQRAPKAPLPISSLAVSLGGAAVGAGLKLGWALVFLFVRYGTLLVKPPIATDSGSRFLRLVLGLSAGRWAVNPVFRLCQSLQKCSEVVFSGPGFGP